jgi:hypothetical protein
MTHVLEEAPTGRSHCRACGRTIARGEPRFGERRSNSFGQGDTTLWFHPVCAAYSRPEPLLEFMNAGPGAPLAELRPIVEIGIAHPRLARLSTAGRSPTARARCRHCHEPIEKDSWRLALVFFEEFRFSPSGFIHAACAGEYMGTEDVIERVKHFNPQLGEAELDELRIQLASKTSERP